MNTQLSSLLITAPTINYLPQAFPISSHWLVSAFNVFEWWPCLFLTSSYSKFCLEVNSNLISKSEISIAWPSQIHSCKNGSPQWPDQSLLLCSLQMVHIEQQAHSAAARRSERIEVALSACSTRLARCPDSGLVHGGRLPTMSSHSRRRPLLRWCTQTHSMNLGFFGAIEILVLVWNPNTLSACGCRQEIQLPWLPLL